MSRIDSFIRRLESQRACLDWAAGQIAGDPGPILEMGLGNGRTYDHLREKCPGRDIFVFDREINAHPDCIPPADRMVLGDFADTLPAAARRFAGQVVLVHADTGTGDEAKSRARAALWAPFWHAMLKPGGLLLSDQPIHFAGLLPQPEQSVQGWRYFIYRRDNNPPAK